MRDRAGRDGGSGFAVALVLVLLAVTVHAVYVMLTQ